MIQVGLIYLPTICDNDRMTYVKIEKIQSHYSRKNYHFCQDTKWGMIALLPNMKIFHVSIVDVAMPFIEEIIKIIYPKN